MPGTTHLGRRASLVALTAALIAGVLPIGAPGVTAVVPASYWYQEGQGTITSDAVSFTSVVPAPSSQTANVTAGGRTLRLGSIDPLVLPVAGVYELAQPVRHPGFPLIETSLGCEGRYVIHEVEYGPDGATTKLAADWRTSCGLRDFDRGSIRFNSTIGFGALVATPSYVLESLLLTGYPVDTTVTISSVGTVPVTISALEFAGANLSWFSVQSTSCTGVTLQPGQSCTTTVRAQSTYAARPAYTSLRAISNATLKTTQLKGFLAAGQAEVAVALAPAELVVGDGRPWTLVANLSSSPVDGEIQFFIDGKLAGKVAFKAGVTRIAIAGTPVAPGAHTAEARYTPTELLATPATKLIKFTALHGTVTTLTASAPKIYSDQKVTLSATVSGPTSFSGGTLRIYDQASNQTLGSFTLTTTGHTLTISVPLPGAGTTRTIVADYFGSPYYAPSTAKVTVQVVADTDVVVNSTSVTPGTFYPYVDSYLDTASIGGNTAEPANVQISIFKSTGSRVAFVDLGTRAGAYSWAWNGRTSTGVMLPNDTYRVEQRFKDATGHVKVITGSVTLSSKRLCLYTTYLYQAPSAAVYSNPSWLGFQFTLPSAATYTSITWQVDGKENVGGVMSIGGWDFGYCAATATWNPDCVNAVWTGLTTTRAWVSRPLDVVYNRSGRTVRTFVDVIGGSGYVYNTRLKVVYGLLK